MIPTRNDPTLPTRDLLVRKGLKFSQLRLLVAIRDLGQIGAAARQVGMTQPAASRLLAQLEALVETRLYTRHARGILLTEAGRILADQAAATLQGLDVSRERIAQTVVGTRGLVKVGSVTGPSLKLLLPVVRELRIAYPSIEVAVQIDPSDKLADALLARDLDFYIGRIPDGMDARPFSLDVVGVEPISLIVRRDHPLSKRVPLSLGECLPYDWVTQPPGGLLRRTFETYLLGRGYALPSRIISTSSTLFTLAMVHETNAIAPLARAAADFFIESGAMGSRLDRLPVAEDMVVEPFAIICRSGETAQPAAERIRGLLLSKAANLRSREYDPQGMSQSRNGISV